jgi:fumarate reductase flavoprotein subunit
VSGYDIIVVGGGGTGLMAAWSAAKEGRAVLLLEKGERLGGTSGMSVGTITATATRLQRSAGIEDNADGHFEDMAKFAGPLVDRDNLELRRLLVDNSRETVEILTDMGVVFVGPLPEPPHRLPRMHAIIPHSRGFIRQLEKACRRQGVEIRTSSPVGGLVVEEGRVTGVRLANGGTERARRAVILASGDISSSPLEYKSRFMSGPLLDISGINPLSTGDGQRMGEEVGGVVVNGDLAWGPEIRFTAPPKPSIISRLPPWPILARLIRAGMKVMPDAIMRPFLLGFVTTFLAPSLQLFRKGAILVDIKGDRFCNELDRPQDQIGRQQGKKAWIVLGGKVARQFNAYPNFISTAPGVGYAYLGEYERTRPDVVFKADTLDALAARMSVPPAALAQSVAAHNASIAPGDERAPIGQGPYYALGPVISWIVFSEGGLEVDTRHRVIHRDGHPIPGLYAAGSAGQGGVLLEGHGHHLGWAFTSGRLAGRNAALEG